MLGALGAHKLKETLTMEKLESFKTGVDYQLFNALGLLLIALLAQQFKNILRWSMGLIAAGTLLFSGSIYLLATGDGSMNQILGPITPIGGSLMIIGWAMVLFAIGKKE